MSDGTYDTGPVLGAPSFLGRLNDLVGNDGAVSLCDLGLVELAGHGGFDEVPKLEGGFRDVGRGDGGLGALASVLGKDWIGPSVSPVDQVGVRHDRGRELLGFKIK